AKTIVENMPPTPLNA
nr:diapause protein, PDP {N-terminal} [Pectinophora gossypiella=pink bollworms, Saunders, hemolymph, Peptide Partial, 15 aa] [Pectinophora gossypiella]